MTKHYRAPAIIRAIQVIEYLGRNNDASKNLSEIARDLGLSKSSLHRIFCIHY